LKHINNLFKSKKAAVHKSIPAEAPAATPTRPPETLQPENVVEPERIQVADPWNVGGSRPFLLEKHPNIAMILASADPNPPKPAGEWNAVFQRTAEDTRGYLAMAYLRHPDPQVRQDTLKFIATKTRHELMVGLTLAQRLTVDPSDEIRRLAANVIWQRGEEELQDTMNYLAGNDEHPGEDGNGSVVYPEQVRQALQILFNAGPTRSDEFRRALIKAWCWHDDRLANLCNALINIWLEGKTYLSEPYRTSARQIGQALHSMAGLDGMKLMFRPVTLLTGSEAASALNHAFNGIGGWLP
jgi:hypothetical protein